MLYYCVQNDLPVQLEIETLFENTCFMLIKQAVSYSFHVLLHRNCPILLSRMPRGLVRVFGGFVWKHVVSLKSLLLLRDVTGKPCWNHGSYLMLVLR